MVRILAAPGPVSYPLVLAWRDLDWVKLEFGKEGDESFDAVADSLTSLVRRGSGVDLITVRQLLAVYPGLRGPRIGVWRRGSAADVLVRAAMDRYGVQAELLYADDWAAVAQMLRDGKVNSAVLTLAIAPEGASPLELMVGAPGACGVSLANPSAGADVRRAYEYGISVAERNPEEAADRVASSLPVRVPRDFVAGVLRRVKYSVEPAGDISGFASLVKRYLPGG